jgi:hypothetical protein
MQTSIFDVDLQGQHYAASQVMYLIDTFLVVAITSSRILEILNSRSSSTIDELELARAEWIDFRDRKARELGFDRHFQDTAFV